jgi:hypothetical protein
MNGRGVGTMDVFSFFLDNIKLSAIIATFFPTIISCIFYYVDRIKLYRSGPVIENYPVGRQSQYEWLWILSALALLGYIAWTDTNQQAMVIASLFILYVGVFKEAHNKIILTEGGIYIQGKYFQWTEVTRFTKTDKEHLKFEGIRMIARDFEVKNINEIDELIIVASSCMSRLHRD